MPTIYKIPGEDGLSSQLKNVSGAENLASYPEEPVEGGGKESDEACCLCPLREGANCRCL